LLARSLGEIIRRSIDGTDQDQATVSVYVMNFVSITLAFIVQLHANLCLALSEHHSSK
jgi:hypothetical protein